MTLLVYSIYFNAVRKRYAQKLAKSLRLIPVIAIHCTTQLISFFAGWEMPVARVPVSITHIQSLKAR